MRYIISIKEGPGVEAWGKEVHRYAGRWHVRPVGHRGLGRAVPDQIVKKIVDAATKEGRCKIID